MKIVYVAGPYTAPTRAGILANVQRAREAAALIASPTIFPLVPHFLGDGIEDIGDYAYWCVATLEVMRRCDAVLLVDGWQGSSGAKGEHEEAIRLGLPVFRQGERGLLIEWARGGS